RSKATALWAPCAAGARSAASARGTATADRAATSATAPTVRKRMDAERRCMGSPRTIIPIVCHDAPGPLILAHKKMTGSRITKIPSRLFGGQHQPLAAPEAGEPAVLGAHAEAMHRAQALQGAHGLVHLEAAGDGAGAQMFVRRHIHRRVAVQGE